MTKFIIFMWLCSSVANDCKLIATPYQTFDSYRDCALFGYQHTVDVLARMPETEINKWHIHTQFMCKEETTI
tara:strand:- start:25 stop:240 length:216 start_codon:yes stop_codon:yes gene_type:complete